MPAHMFHKQAGFAFLTKEELSLCLFFFFFFLRMTIDVSYGFAAENVFCNIPLFWNFSKLVNACENCKCLTLVRLLPSISPC